MLYGTGLRQTECLQLRVKDIDFAQNQVIVRDGKGMESRVTMLPRSLAEELAFHLEIIKTQAQLAELWDDEISDRTISRALQKFQFTRKKNLWLPRT